MKFRIAIEYDPVTKVMRLIARNYRVAAAPAIPKKKLWRMPKKQSPFIWNILPREMRKKVKFMRLKCQPDAA